MTGAVAYRSAAGRWVLLATVLGSALAFIDATVVTIALPRIAEDLDATTADLQWTVNGYALTLAAFLLLGGALGDRLGRRRVFLVGVVWFAVASVACALAPTVGVLVAARVLQGVGGALLTPGSLAILQSTFAGDDRGRAIGAWRGLGFQLIIGAPNDKVSALEPHVDLKYVVLKYGAGRSRTKAVAGVAAEAS